MDLKPWLSLRINVLALQDSNRRKAIPSHIYFLSESMKQEIKDFTNPLIVAVSECDLNVARSAFEKGLAHPCRIVVRFTD